MDKKFGKYSEEQWEAMLAAMREEKFGGERITEELEPLIKEFFVCETKKARRRAGALVYERSEIFAQSERNKVIFCF